LPQVNPGKFQKMKVNLAAQVLSHSTTTALQLCVARKLLPEAALTTAWFLQTVNDWFDVMNARFPLASLFKSSTGKVEMLKMVHELFLNLHFGGRDGWKPIQTGVRLSITTVLDMYNDLVVDGTYKFLMTGRLTQDCVENLFSQIRSRGDTHPKPVHLRHCIRLISLSQYNLSQCS
jgi:DNA transposase THAP9